jgi:hypothetical protein
MWELEGLSADRPSSRLKDKLALFGQFVGDWNIDRRSLNRDGTWVKSKGRLHWRWILQGRALQDTWTTIGPRKGSEIVWGTTVRFYDPKIDAWRSVWISPRAGAVGTFVGRKVGDEIVLECKTTEDVPPRRPMRWIFSDIKPYSFRWRGETSKDGGKTFIVDEVMRITRRRSQP